MLPLCKNFPLDTASSAQGRTHLAANRGRTFFKKVLRNSKLFHSDSETTVKRIFAILFVLRTLEAGKHLFCVQSIQKEAADLFSVCHQSALYHGGLTAAFSLKSGIQLFPGFTDIFSGADQHIPSRMGRRPSTSSAFTAALLHISRSSSF